MNKYNIIYADCPWNYDTPSNPRFGGATYPTMTTEEINSIPVWNIADKHSALFLWATYPKLAEALEVISAWGFKYRTVAFTWIKTNKRAGTLYSGLGYWTNANAEICLFAKRGSPKRIARNVKEVVIAPLGRHSAKPPEVRNRIVRLMGDVPRIELFARERVPGWDALGNEIDGLDIRRSIHMINIAQLINLNNNCKDSLKLGGNYHV